MRIPILGHYVHASINALALIALLPPAVVRTVFRRRAAGRSPDFDVVILPETAEAALWGRRVR